MLKGNTQLIIRAETLEQQSREEIREKNYDAAVLLLEEAIQIYDKLGYTVQVENLRNRVASLKQLKEKTEDVQLILEENTSDKSDDEIITLEKKGNGVLEIARKLALDNKFDEALNRYNEALQIFESINSDFECKQILWQINEIKEYQRVQNSPNVKNINLNVKDIVTLSFAEKRRRKLQSGTYNQQSGGLKVEKKKSEALKDTNIKPDAARSKLFNQMREKSKKEMEAEQQKVSYLHAQEELRQKQMQEKREKYRLIQEQKKHADELQSEAERLLDEGNRYIRDKKYTEAKSSYLKSIDLFRKLGWTQQVGILEEELRNINRYKMEESKKQQQIQAIKQKEQEQYQKRIEETKSLQAQIKQEQSKIVTLSPESRSILTKIKLLKGKIEKEEKLGKIKRVLERYRIIIELYKSIPKEEADFSAEISAIESKITELKEKM